MVKFIGSLLVFGSVVGGVFLVKDSHEIGTVTKIVDGDTIKVNSKGVGRSIRLIGIDAPESNALRYGYVECFGKESKEYLKSLLPIGSTVQIEYDTSQGEFDSLGRTLGYINFNGHNLNEVMISDGYAWEYTYNMPYKYQNQFADTAREASAKKKGLWGKLCNGERKSVNRCEDKQFCYQMNDCDEAMHYLNKCNLDKLDKDGDGVPCESLCLNDKGS